jgi:assimilatory nitrate reductase catalytic subunit
VVCQCHGVRENAIVQAMGAGQDAVSRLAAAQGALSCGTTCGSCLPELRELAAAQPTISERAA